MTEQGDAHPGKPPKLSDKKANQTTPASNSTSSAKKKKHVDQQEFLTVVLKE